MDPEFYTFRSSLARGAYVNWAACSIVSNTGPTALSQVSRRKSPRKKGSNRTIVLMFAFGVRYKFALAPRE